MSILTSIHNLHFGNFQIIGKTFVTYYITRLCCYLKKHVMKGKGDNLINDMLVASNILLCLLLFALQSSQQTQRRCTVLWKTTSRGIFR